MIKLLTSNSPGIGYIYSTTVWWTSTIEGAVSLITQRTQRKGLV